jgi:hypothetical protein
MFIPSMRGYAVGFVTTYYFQATNVTGLYATGRYHFEDYNYYPHARRYEVIENKGHMLHIIGGFKAVLRYGFFAMPGLGIQVGMHDFKKSVGTTVTDSKSNRLRAFPYLEFKLGLNF